MTDSTDLDANKDSIAQPESSVKAEGVQPISAQTAGYTFNHTMLRVKDPAKSLAFYTGILGMTLLAVKKFPAMGFDLYFLAKGTETQADFSYHDGNGEPQGFGHICFSVPSLDEAVAWFDKNNVEFKKRPEDGSMKNIAFIKDVDGYWIEIVQADLMG